MWYTLLVLRSLLVLGGSTLDVMHATIPIVKSVWGCVEDVPETIMWGHEWGLEGQGNKAWWSLLGPQAWWHSDSFAIGIAFVGCYTKYSIYVTMEAFRMTFPTNKWTNVAMNDGWVYPLVKIPPSLVSNLWWNIVMDSWNLDEKSLAKWQYFTTL